MNLENTRKLRDLIKLCGGEIIGRKKMQKIVFIVQRYLDPFKPSFEYQWDHYGVYSVDLSNELEIGQFFNMLEETSVLDHGYQSYAITVVDDTKATFFVEDEKLIALTEFLYGKEPRLLEVLSSIIYFRDQGCSPTEEGTKLRALKGHLCDFFNDAYLALEEVEEIVK